MAAIWKVETHRTVIFSALVWVTQNAVNKTKSLKAVFRSRRWILVWMVRQGFAIKPLFDRCRIRSLGDSEDFVKADVAEHLTDLRGRHLTRFKQNQLSMRNL